MTGLIWLRSSIQAVLSHTKAPNIATLHEDSGKQLKCTGTWQGQKEGDSSKEQNKGGGQTESANPQAMAETEQRSKMGAAAETKDVRKGQI